jgi:hypothetical protein
MPLPIPPRSENAPTTITDGATPIPRYAMPMTAKDVDIR